MSQLEVALAAGVSARHLSFLETGRAQPSREMLVLLAGVLDIPLRERNALLQAAGFAPLYRETALTAPEMSDIRHALELILRQHEPFPAVALDRSWNVCMMNAAYARFLGGLLPGVALPEPLAVVQDPRPNALRLLFQPEGVRRSIGNWEPVARELLGRVHRDAMASGDPETCRLRAELLAMPGVPEHWHDVDLLAPPALVVPLELHVAACTLRLFTTTTTLGSPQDVTLQELRIESFHAADAETEALVRAFASGG
jgi:transcriptional regulator with XRE-family HTH domain